MLRACMDSGKAGPRPYVWEPRCDHEQPPGQRGRAAVWRPPPGHACPGS